MGIGDELRYEVVERLDGAWPTSASPAHGVAVATTVPWGGARVAQMDSLAGTGENHCPCAEAVGLALQKVWVLTYITLPIRLRVYLACALRSLDFAERQWHPDKVYGSSLH